MSARLKQGKPLKKSPNDHKEYRALTLSNGLRVLLIHNNQSQQSAAALAVNVGHFNDPQNRQGMAHFLEHMLFLGTQKYPEGSEYQKFISQHSGSHNAWTGTEHTCFFFDINHQFYEAALDRFSQFFIAPLLSKSFVEKERLNIDAEFKLKLKDDVRRLYDVHKETINSAHPFAKFSVGNSQTLADFPERDLQTEVEGFFKRYYRAQYMTLALEGPQSLDNLEILAERFFSLIKPTSKALPPITEPLYHKEHQGLLICVNPVKDDKQLIISFAMPCIDPLYRHKPEAVLAYLLGHESKGSLLSYLKNQHWALGMSAGAGINGSNFKDFNLSIALTEKGEENIEEIITSCFSYIELLKTQPIPEFYYHEKQALSEVAFTYQEKMKPLDSVSQLVLNMQHYEPEHYIFGDYIMEGFNKESLQELIDYLTPTNMRVVHISQRNTFDQESRWYHMPYRTEAISSAKLNAWETPPVISALSLPKQNPYIISNPEVLIAEQGKAKIPQLIEETSGLKIWFKQDSIFNVPKGYIYIAIDSPITVSSTLHIAMTRLFVNLFSDAVLEEHYEAELAGIHYHLYAHQGGMTLQLSGISSNQGKLLKSLLQSLFQQAFSPEKFTLFKKQLITQWENASASKSISQLFATLSATLQPKSPSSMALAEALEPIDYEVFSQFQSQIFKAIAIEALIHGNWNINHAQDITKDIKVAFQDTYHEKHQVTPAMLDTQGELLLSVNNPNHDNAAVLYYPLPNRKLKTSALTMLTSQLLAPAFFQQMRTEKQYGYLVGVGFVPINRYPGIAFYIQSPHTEPAALLDAMNTFINETLSLISNISAVNWENLQQGLVGQLEEKDSSLRIKSQRFWSSISNKETDFKQKQKLIEIVKKVKLTDIQNFIENYLLDAQVQNRVLLTSSQIAPQTELMAELNGKKIQLDDIHKKFPLKS